MGFLWFLAAVVFLILWLRAKSSDESTGDSGYGQGYWDGYRAFGDKVAELLLHKDTLDKKELQRLIDEGNGAVASSDASSHAPTAQLQRLEEVGIISEGTGEYDESVQQPVRHMPEMVAPPPVLTDAEIAEQKEKQTLKNLNLLLYVASFLIVAAAATFVTLVMPATVKLLSLIAVTIAFYGTGLVLYRNSERLRPAAMAFVGTGLAILPFIGFALNSLGGMSPEAAWFATSFVGLVAYMFAAVRLQSQLVSYLTMAFVLSLALSAVSTLGLGLMWYFIVIVGVSLVCNSLHIVWPNALPKVFAVPVEQTGQLATPIALVASLFVMDEMKLYMYEALYGVATAHYLVIWLERRSLGYEAVVRVLAHLTLLLVAADVSGLGNMYAEYYDVAQFGVWVLVLALLQAIYSLVRVGTHGVNRTTERLFVASSIVFMVAGMACWLDTDHASRWVSLSLATIGVIALGATLRFREAAWAYVGLVSSVVLPYVVARHVIEPQVSYDVLAGGFTFLALFALMGLERVQSLGRSQPVRMMLAASAAVYAMCILASGFWADSSVALGWTALASGSVFVVLSYLLRAPGLELVGALAGLVSMIAWVDVASVESAWRLPVIVVVTAVLAVAAAYVHHYQHESERRNYLLAFAVTVFAGLVFTIGSGAEIVRTATVLLLLGGVAAMALRLVLAARAGTLLQISQISYIILPVLALFTAFDAGLGWVTLVLAVSTVIVWLASYVEKLPAALPIGNAILVGMLIAMWQWLEFDTEWALYGVTWIAAAVFYGVYWLMRDKGDEWRQWASLGSTWVVLAVAAWVNMWFGVDAFVLASAGSLLAIAVTLGVHGYLTRARGYVELAVYVGTFSVQRMVGVLLPETNLVVYGHWWAATIGIVAWWSAGDVRQRAMIALAFVTGSTGLYALMDKEGYSYVFLIEHIIILVIGAMLRKQWAVWWGIIATVVAVLYFLRGYTFLVLLFLGFLLILFVMWRLGKMGKK